MVSAKLKKKGPKVVALVGYLRSIIPNDREVGEALDMKPDTFRPKRARGEVWPWILDFCEIMGIEKLDVRKICEDNGIPWEPKIKPNEVPLENRRGRPKKKKPT